MRTMSVNLVLNEPEAAALRSAARADLRRPRDQARHLLRLALLGVEDSLLDGVPTNSNRAGNVLADTSAAADVSTIPSRP